MSSSDKHITPWSASDVRKYLDGELSPREMHQLEKAALDDPFLADAIEGFSQQPAVEKDLDELQTRLAARVSEKKGRVIVAPWMRVAAAITLLAGLGFTAWYTLLDNSKAKLAKEESVKRSPTARQTLPPAKTDTAQAPRPIESVSNSISTSPPGPAAGSSSAHAAYIQPKTLARAKPQDEEYAKSGADSIGIIPTPSVQRANRILMDSLKLKKDAVDANYLKSIYRSQNVVLNGQVLDFNNHPLANAYLTVSGPSNAITTTDALGQFQLHLRSQDTVQQLTVALEGYLNASLAVNTLNAEPATGNTIFLRENPSALSEVVVTGLGRNRKEAFATAPYKDRNEKLDSFWIKVAPVGGRLTYLQYLETAKKTLPIDSTIHGTEIISFEVDLKGLPSAFKIEQSLSPAHDAGVIRLISEGALWKTNHGKNIRAMVSVTFP